MSEQFPPWLDKTEVSLVGVLTMRSGEQITVEIVEFDAERNEIVVDVINPSRSDASGLHGRESIPVDDVVSFDPQSRETQPWPYSDPCRSAPFSLARFGLMTALFLCMTAGGVALFVLWANTPYGLQEASVLVYTIFVVFFTFAATREWRRYLFTCPAVRTQIPRLVWRHVGFVGALIVLQSLLLVVRPDLPEWLKVADSKGTTVFDMALYFLCIGLGFAQVAANRSLLERAHKEFSTHSENEFAAGQRG